ncbi:lytic transglycosylase domain-containing protein [Paraburkholderia sediminicola]|uniref:lytic transglycosylase domain-containing protein n=1 Tax=Paraburkholderia sediminicola TaxID=458836 RepID=UPI0038B8DE6B
MLPADFIALAQQCAPQVSPVTMAAIVRTESGFNPYAIGVVHGRLVRQPVSMDEAVATAHALAGGGLNFSVGLAQVNRTNWPAYRLDEERSFEPCRNLAAAAAILRGCFASARRAQAPGRRDPQTALRASLSCYASGNFSTGYRTGYVQRVVNAAGIPAPPSAPVIVPPIPPIPVVPADSEVAARPERPQPARHRVSAPSEPSPGRPADDPDRSAVVF